MQHMRVETPSFAKKTWKTCGHYSLFKHIQKKSFLLSESEMKTVSESIVVELVTRKQISFGNRIVVRKCLLWLVLLDIRLLI